MKHVFLFLCVIFFFAYSCAPVRIVVPLEKGQSQLSVSAGGPLVRFAGAIIPLPLSSVCFSHGMTQYLTYHVGLHTTSLLFGNLHLEGSTTLLVYQSESEKSGLSLTPGTYVLFRHNESPFVLPFSDLNFFYKLTDKALVYASYSNYFDIQHPVFSLSSLSRWYIPSVQFGHVFQKNRISIQVELRYQHFLRSNENIVVDYISPTNRGALALHIGCGFHLQRKKQ